MEALRRTGVILGTSIIWGNDSFEAIKKKALEYHNCSGFVQETTFILDNGKVKTKKNNYFFGSIIPRTEALEKFSETPGIDKWLEGYKKDYFIYIPRAHTVMKIVDDERFYFVKS